MPVIVIASIAALAGMVLGFLAGLFLSATLNSETQFVEPSVKANKPSDQFTSNSTTQFVDAVSGKEKFNNANNVGDMLK